LRRIDQLRLTRIVHLTGDRGKGEQEPVFFAAGMGLSVRTGFCGTLMTWRIVAAGMKQAKKNADRPFISWSFRMIGAPLKD